MDDAIGFSAIELASLTNVDVPSGGLVGYRSPQNLSVNVQPLEKLALDGELRAYQHDGFFSSTQSSPPR